MPAIVDTGPLVAYFDKAERHHRWAVGCLEAEEAPLLICEPVLAETMYLLGNRAKAVDSLWGLLENGALAMALHVEEHTPALRRLMHKYRDTPMSLADACLVRMAELYDHHAIMTIDSDFSIYRKQGRTPLALIQPGGLPS